MNQQWQSFLEQQALQPINHTLSGDGLYPLVNTFLSIDGIDAATFLQGQLSCHMEHISLTHSSLGSHCSPKGRMHSSFRIIQHSDNAYLLKLHPAIADNALQALAKYIVFSKANISRADHIIGIGLHGNAGLATLKAWCDNKGIHLPTMDYQQIVDNNTVIMCTSAQYNSYELYTDQDNAIELWEVLSSELTAFDTHQHQLLQHQLGLAFVDGQTQTSFTPQSFNYQVLPAISFDKGCYTGQEIIARMHYRGQLKRHMYHITANYEKALASGLSVSLAGKDVGDILSAVALGNQQWDLLISLTHEAATLTTLQVNDMDITVVRIVELPYVLDIEN